MLFRSNRHAPADGVHAVEDGPARGEDDLLAAAGAPRRQMRPVEVDLAAAGGGVDQEAGPSYFQFDYSYRGQLAFGKRSDVAFRNSK